MSNSNVQRPVRKIRKKSEENRKRQPALITGHRLMKTLLVPRTGIEPARLSTLDPKSSASANFATSALSSECKL